MRWEWGKILWKNCFVFADDGGNVSALCFRILFEKLETWEETD